MVAVETQKEGSSEAVEQITSPNNRVTVNTENVDQKGSSSEIEQSDGKNLVDRNTHENNAGEEKTSDAHDATKSTAVQNESVSLAKTIVDALRSRGLTFFDQRPSEVIQQENSLKRKNWEDDAGSASSTDAAAVNKKHDEEDEFKKSSVAKSQSPVKSAKAADSTDNSLPTQKPSPSPSPSQNRKQQKKSGKSGKNNKNEASKSAKNTKKDESKPKIDFNPDQRKPDAEEKARLLQKHKEFVIFRKRALQIRRTVVNYQKHGVIGKSNTLSRSGASLSEGDLNRVAKESQEHVASLNRNVQRAAHVMAGVGFITEKQFEIMFDITPLERGKSAPKPSVGKKQAAAVTQERSASADHAGIPLHRAASAPSTATPSKPRDPRWDAPPSKLDKRIIKFFTPDVGEQFAKLMARALEDAGWSVAQREKLLQPGEHQQAMKKTAYDAAHPFILNDATKSTFIRMHHNFYVFNKVGQRLRMDRIDAAYSQEQFYMTQSYFTKVMMNVPPQSIDVQFEAIYAFLKMQYFGMPGWHGAAAAQGRGQPKVQRAGFR